MTAQQGGRWRIGIPRKNEFDEWEVPVFDTKTGKRNEAKTYYTDDRTDAAETYKMFVKDKDKWV